MLIGAGKVMPMQGGINYGRLMHNAMRGLIREVLSKVAAEGLPGEHHFFITFDTRHPDVEMADWLADRYPSEITVVMQHWFEDLEVGEDGFAVTLSFGNHPERLYIPYDALQTFVDPSVEFGLRFETTEDDGEEDDETTAVDALHELIPEAPMAEDVPHATDHKDAEIVSLDKFRK
jgi:hypothetical protein